ncbi:MAG: ParB family chromosome partitioning protein [Motiliproteus sp.]|jgi:ParB family chromosome partitioning protein
MLKKRGLGRGLDALLAGSALHEDSGELPRVATTNGLEVLPLDKIQRGIYQPRRDMDQAALEELANSIRAQGVIQPIVVRPIDMGRYEIIAGERRWRAATLAGLTEIPASIRDVPDEAAIAMALIENIQRENLSPIEEAMALQRLMDEFDLTQQKAAEAVGKSRTTVTNLLRLLKLTTDAKRMLEYGDLEMGHARALLALEGDKQIKAAKEVVARGMSVRQTEALVKQMQTAPKLKEKSVADPGIEQLQQRYNQVLGLQVKISHTDKGDGKLTISYKTLNDIESILHKIQ